MSTLSSVSPLFSPLTIYPPPAKKQRKISLTQTYFLAHTARAKLSREASRPEHDLRVLVGHANMLDSLMLELADAEKEQEKWFNQTVLGANGKLSGEQQRQPQSQSRSKHIEWADTIVEEPEDDWDPEDLSSGSDTDSDDSDDYGKDEDFSSWLSRSQQQQQQQPPSTPTITSREFVRFEDEDDDGIVDDDEEDYDELALTRTSSRSQQQPPDLLDESDDSSSEDDESVPRTPPHLVLDSFNEKEVMATTELYSSKQQSTPSSFPPLLSSPESDQAATPLFSDDFFLSHQQERGPLIEAF